MIFKVVMNYLFLAQRIYIKKKSLEKDWGLKHFCKFTSCKSFFGFATFVITDIAYLNFAKKLIVLIVLHLQALFSTCRKGLLNISKVHSFMWTLFRCDSSLNPKQKLLKLSFMPKFLYVLYKFFNGSDLSDQ
jgi:hypothetical protein